MTREPWRVRDLADIARTARDERDEARERAEAAEVALAEMRAVVERIHTEWRACKDKPVLHTAHDTIRLAGEIGQAMATAARVATLAAVTTARGEEVSRE